MHGPRPDLTRPVSHHLTGHATLLHTTATAGPTKVSPTPPLPRERVMEDSRRLKSILYLVGFWGLSSAFGDYSRLSVTILAVEDYP